MRAIKGLFSLVLFILALSLFGCGGGGGGGDNGGGGDGSNGGTKSAPKILSFSNNFSYAGVMDAFQGVSYFKITGLIANENYQVGISTSSDLAYIGYSSSGYTGSFNCTASGDACKANTSGELYLMVYSVSGPTVQSSYTLSMYSKISEGSPSLPKNLTSLLPYSATLPASNFKSFFVVNNLTVGNSYTVGLEAGSDTSIDLRVYQNQFQTEACTALSNVSVKSCTFTAANNQLWATVYGTGDFNLVVTDNGVPATVFSPEGTLNSPLTMNFTTDGLTGSGQVDATNSYYVINGLSVNTEYRIVMKNIVDDNVDLSVYGDSSYSSAACVSEKTGTYTENCLVTSDSGGSIWVRVTGVNTVQYLGANFDIYTYTYFPNEGDFYNNIQLNYNSGLNYTGTVDTYSYYQIYGLQAGSSYLVDLSGYTNIVSGITTAAGTCNTQEQSVGVQRCLAEADASGVIKLRVRAGTYWSSGLGSKFNLSVSLSPYQSEGSTSLPVILTSGVTHNGEIGGANSYYRFDGLTAGSAYTITVGGMISNQRFYVFDDVADLWKTSSATCNGYSSNSSCTRQAISTSMWIMVDDNYSINGTALTLDVKASPYQAEGSAITPVILGFGTANLPHSGSTDTTESYYEIQGVTAGTEYVISLDNIVASGSYASMYIYDDFAKINSNLSADYIGYRSVSAGARGFSRVTPSGTSLWIKVDGYDSGVGSFFELNAAISSANESLTIDSSVTTVPFTRASSSSEVGSDYIITNLLPNQLYYISLTDMTADVDLKVINYNTSFSTNPCDSQVGLTNEQCLYETTASGELYIDIDTSKSLYGAFYNLGITLGPSSEGTATNPVEVIHDNVGGTTTRSSEVGTGISYYKITGLSSGNMYEVRLTGLAGDANLTLFKDSSYTSGSQCSSNNTGNADEVCGGLADITGALYISVDSAYISSTISHSLFTLDIRNGILPEGTSVSGQAISYAGGLATYSGKVDITDSYYVINGLNPKTSYSILTSAMTDNVQLYVYTDSGYSSLACSSTLTGTTDESCSATTPNGGAAGTAKLYVKISGSLTVIGSTYSLQITP